MSYGTEKFEGSARQRIRITNVLVVLTSLMAVPYIVFFSIYDFEGLKYPIMLLAGTAILFQLTPFLHVWNPYAGGLYNLTIWISFALSISYLLSAQSGVHFFMIAGAASAIAIFGVRQNLLSVLSITLGVGSFIYVDRNFLEPAPFLELSPTLLNAVYFSAIPSAISVIFYMVYYAFSQMHRAERLLQQEYEYSERLLANMLPGTIAAQLKRNPGQTIADAHENVTILFADIVGFTPRATTQSAAELVKFLNQLFTRFDALATKHGLEKIKTLGDAFMVAGGMPEYQEDHAERVARMALDMVSATDDFSREMSEKIQLRIGIHSGPAVAGVIGTQKPFYDVWGDTVNIAARLESFGTNGKIQVTAETKDRLSKSFEFAKRGKVEIKGKGNMELWYLESGK
ncbi:MAG: adenylate/guanylate cyclase domain-containing protein [Rhodobacteraceae bacterium]|nr:adenylate/guanylate cyclase domain-containing protein [Paracoccaceae bacterium]